MQALILSHCANWFSLLGETLILGILGSVIASLITWLVASYCNKRNDSKKYGFIAGKYEGYSYQDENSNFLKKEVQSYASIKYEEKNLLKIKVDYSPGVPVEKNNEWEGTISLDSINYGDLAWHYTRYHDSTTIHKFGIKKVVIRKINNQTHILLTETDPNNKGDFKKEVFKRI